MLISYKWLKKYLPGLDSVPKEKLAEELTGKLAEVESIRPVRQELSKVYCGEVLSVEPVEGSKKLSYCQVALSNEQIKKVVCGAPNVVKGAKVALVLAGGRVYDAHSTKPGATFTVESREVMGVLSEGMICSGKELGLNNDHEGILILEPEMPLGTDLRELLADHVFEIENKSISHRPDCFSHMGIARELSAIFELELNEDEQETPLIPTKELPLEVQVKVDGEVCPRFTAICLADVNIHTSPLWLQAMLSATGVRPINNVVDAANYVMFDKGQPLHTYDYDKVDSKKLVVRMARDNEKIKALDEREYQLDEDMLIIANGSKVDDIAGIMGGENSEITNETKNIIIEAANFNMYSVRRTSRKLGIRTEASTRFEKGLDPDLALTGMKDAVQLITDLGQGEVASELVDIYQAPRKEREITLDLSLVKRFLGIEVSTREIVNYLRRLGLSVDDPEKISTVSLSPELNLFITVTIPTFRSDLKIEADLLEEIARMYGYENFKPTLPVREITGHRPDRAIRTLRLITDTLAASGMDELLTYSFVGREIYEKLNLKLTDCLRIKNPLTPEYTHMRNLLIPNMLEKIGSNMRKYDSFKAFELGRVIKKELDTKGIHIQPLHVAGISYSLSEEVVYFELKGILERLAEELNLKLSFAPVKSSGMIAQPLLHPGRSAQVFLGTEPVGFLGELHPALMKKLEYKGRVGLFELNASLLSEKATEETNFTPMSVFQEIRRDLSVWVDSKLPYADIEKAVGDLEEPLLRSVNLKDVFSSKEEKRKSLTLSLKLQSDTKTLTEEEINTAVKKVTSLLEKRFRAELRDSK